MRMKLFLIAASSTVLFAMLILPLGATLFGATPMGASDQCIQKSRGTLYAQTTNERYNCEFDGKKLMLQDFGRRVAAPEGTYQIPAKVSAPGGNAPAAKGGTNCYIGKGGYLLYCSR